MFSKRERMEGGATNAPLRGVSDPARFVYGRAFIRRRSLAASFICSAEVLTGRRTQSLERLC
ncbi:MAG: hypothetical protein ACFFEX_05595, partial [Candidatus Thorarchaeota archaeon]